MECLYDKHNQEVLEAGSDESLIYDCPHWPDQSQKLGNWEGKEESPEPSNLKDNTESEPALV